VATDVGAIPQIAIEGFDQLVAPDDIEGLAGAISTILQRDPNPNAVNAIHVGGWDATAERLGDVLEAVCQSHAYSRSASADACFAGR
jgi:glycosyltransferase involved in cell wall biosynthesis